MGKWMAYRDRIHRTHSMFVLASQQLEDAGLKWAVLSTASWDDMYEVLCDYVKERKEEDPNNEWDGNVPANYKTNDDPPKALGRWINRQRSNYVKKKLKKEHIDKLSGLGLKWAVHDRSRYSSCSSATFAPKVPNAVPSKPASTTSNGKDASATKTNATVASPATSMSTFSRKVDVSTSNAVVSDSSSGAAPSGNDKVKEMKVAAE